ncbi:oligosaccharide flippase family protein, partial [Paraburkholderia sp. Se-20369]|nr:oligosaccharide flippase family protein [Paraburkholderia sp. Se-20369]
MARASNVADASPAAGGVGSGAGLGRNFAAMLLWQIGNYLVPLATFPYLARVLGPAQFGVVGYVTALTVYGTILTEWGFNLSGPRAAAQWRHDRAGLGELVWSIVGAKACFCLLSIAMLAAFLWLAPDAAGLRTAAWIGWIGVAANVVTLNWLLQGMERFSLFAGIALISRFATLPLTFWLVRAPEDVAAALAIQAAAALLAAAGSLIVAHR